MDPTTPQDIQAASTSSAQFSPQDRDPVPADIDLLDEPAQKQRTGLQWVIGSGVVMLIGVGSWLGYQTLLQKPPAAVEVVTVPAARDDLEITITEAGIVELGGQQTFNAPSDVTVQAVLVEERQRVSQGQVLLELRDRALQQQLDDQLVTNRINEIDWQRQLEILDERRSRLTDAELRLQDSEDLLAQGYISEDDYRADKRTVEEAQSALRDAEVEVTKAQLQVQQDQVKTENIRLRLEDNQIVAPIDAIVLNVDTKAGDGVQREGRLLSIGDPTKETIRLQLSTLNAARVAIGMPVRVSIIGPNPEVFEGQVVRVSPQAIAEQQNAEQATVEAEARLTQPSGVLIPGSAVSVEVVLERRQNVLVVPITALQRDQETPYVWVKDAENLARQREVQTGLETLEAVEIVSGLQAGDEVVVSLPPDVTLVPGQPLAAPATGDGEATGGDRSPEGGN